MPGCAVRNASAREPSRFRCCRDNEIGYVSLPYGQNGITRAKYDSCLLKYKAILNAKLENYAESPTKNILTTQSCRANISNLLSYLNLSSRERSCVYQYGTMAEKGHDCKHSPFFFYHYTRRFFSSKLHSSFFFLQIYTHRFFFRITRDVFFRDDAIITRDIFSMQYYTRRFFNAIITRDVFSNNYTCRFFRVTF
jgi:hypothetical protein